MGLATEKGEKPPTLVSFCKKLKEKGRKREMEMWGGNGLQHREKQTPWNLLAPSTVAVNPFTDSDSVQYTHPLTTPPCLGLPVQSQTN